ncbi:PHP domain-containing protein, partial [Abiotrophia defectiva]
MLFNVHSANSLLASTLTIPAYVEAAKERGYQILGLADVHSLQGALDFYNRCQAAGLKAMIGATIKLPGALKQTQVYPFLVYALNQAGYYELIGLIRRLSHQPLSPGAIWDYLTQSCHNLVYISCGHASEVEQTLIHSGDSEASLVLERLGQVFGLANVYLGVAAFPYNPVEGEAVKALAKSQQVPLVVGQGVSTLNQGDAFSLKVLEAIGANETLDVELRAMQGVHYVYNWADLEAQYVRLGLADCLANSRQLADRMQLTLPQNQAFLPKFPTPDQVPASQYLRNMTQVALDTLSPANRRAYQERLDYELEVIDSMGFSDYFLIVWDIIVYCQSHAIRVGPGRGSAAGSLVSYLLGITRVDPIQYNLLFERFLNPERYNMPDIDMDIPDNKRQQVLHYVVERYGQEQVAQIATLGTFGARAAMRDTLRVLGADSETLRVWARAIPKELDISLPQAYQKSTALRQLVSQSETNQQLFQV